LSDFGGRRFVDYFVPGMIAFGTMSVAYGNLAARLVFRRETGALQRLRSTPLPMTAFLGGLILNAVVVIGIVSVLVITTGMVAFDVGAPAGLLAFAFVIAVGAATFCALGLALAQAIPSAEAADAMVFGTLLPLQFISGMFDPVPAHSSLARVADVFPVRHLILGLIESFDGRVAWGHVAVLLAWGVAAALVAGRWFRWSARV
jgi:ABC-2 type transport system permease protein